MQRSLNYSHAAYCIKRGQEVDKPKAITVSKKVIPNLKKTLPVKGVENYEASDDDEVKILKGSNIPFEDLEIDAMPNFKHQLIQSQEEYTTNNKQSEFPMYKVSVNRKCNAIIPTTHAVILKNVHQKKQENYDKLMSNAF